MRHRGLPSRWKEHRERRVARSVRQSQSDISLSQRRMTKRPLRRREMRWIRRVSGITLRRDNSMAGVSRELDEAWCQTMHSLLSVLDTMARPLKLRTIFLMGDEWPDQIVCRASRLSLVVGSSKSATLLERMPILPSRSCTIIHKRPSDLSQYTSACRWGGSSWGLRKPPKLSNWRD